VLKFAICLALYVQVKILLCPSWYKLKLSGATSQGECIRWGWVGPSKLLGLTFGLSSTYFLSCLENLVVICHNIESHTLWEKSFHTRTLHELIVLLSLLCMQWNLCLSYPCLSNICLHNFDMLCDYFLKTGIHGCAFILVKDLTMLLLFLSFSLMFSFSSFPFCL
jgi:hypothetical protein